MPLEILSAYKSFLPGQVLTTDELPALTVITGKNGSGKTQFLEALSSFVIQPTGWASGDGPRLITSIDLQTLAEPSGYTPRHQQVQNVRQQLLYAGGDPRQGGERLVQLGLFTAAQLERSEELAGNPIAFWTDSDWNRYTPFSGSSRDLFGFSIGALFSVFNQALTQNSFMKWRQESGESSMGGLSTIEFEALHGEAPWLTMSRVLSIIGLPYFFEPPAPSLDPAYVEPRLVDENGRGVRLEDLSSGERTLLQVAMSMYSVERRLDQTSKPSMILLDEPDAALHPSMAHSLLRLIQEELIGRLNVPVVMTTHSPTTVALAPQAALYVMQRGSEPRLVKVSTDQALKALLVGVPTLSVDANNRRLVIVEGPNDERLYSGILSILLNSLSMERSLQFMAAGGHALPNGCAAVVDLVGRLRTNGNIKVWGLIDRDSRSQEPDESVLFDPTRYAIENVILDPLAVGVLLLREQERRLEELVSPVNYLSFEAKVDQAQDLVDAISKLVVPPSSGERRRIAYVEGLDLWVNEWWLDTQGHELQSRLVEVFPQLKKHRSRLLDEVVMKVWRDRPSLVPLSTLQLFQRFLE